MDPADSILIERGTASTADTDQEVVAGVHIRRGRELWTLARRLGLSAEEADDAVQEALTRLWQELAERLRHGSSWTQATISGPHGPVVPNATVAGIASNGSRMIAVGSLSAGSGRSATVWLSADGSTWTRVAADPSFAGGVMNAVVFDGQEFVAVGGGSGSPEIWTSGG